MAEQFELNLKKRAGVTIEYQFPQKHLKGVIRDEIKRITGNPDLLAEDLDIPDVREEIKVILGMRDLVADFQEDRVVIRVGEKDITGEYYEDYEKARKAG